MSTPLLIYAGFSAVAVVMCLWAILSAVVPNPEHTGGHRMLIGLVALGCLAATGVSTFATELGIPQLFWVAGLMPLLTIAATWSNVVSLRGTGPLLSGLGLPITLFNMLQVGIYSVAFVQHCLGVDLGTWGCALTGADALLQRLIGDADALENPVWFRLPIVLPLWGSMTFFRHCALAGSCALATVILVSFTLVMPHGFSRSRSYHSASPTDVARGRPLGITVPWGCDDLTPEQVERIRNHVRALGVSHVTFELSSADVAQAPRMEQLRSETRWARREGLQVVAIARPAPRFEHLPALSVGALAQDMGTAHRTAAALRPDVLVLYSGPLGSLADVIAGSTSSDDWFATFRTSADLARGVNPDVRVAVSLEQCDSRAEKMFRRLKDDNSPVDIVGIAIRPGERFLNDVEADLTKLFEWCKRAPGTRKVAVFEAGCTPQINGGEHGRWNLLSRVLNFGSRARDVIGVGLDSLYSGRRDQGLVRRCGRRGLTYHQLVQGHRRPPMELPPAGKRAPSRPGK